MPQLDQFTYFTQFFWSCLFFFTFYILICNDRYGVLGISRILKLRNQLLSHRGGKNTQNKDPKSLEDILRKGFHTGVSYMYSSLFEVSQWCKAADLFGKRKKITFILYLGFKIPPALYPAILVIVLSGILNVAWADGYAPAELIQGQINEGNHLIGWGEDPVVFVPEIPVLEQPLLTDEIRRAQLYNRLAPHSFVSDFTLKTMVDIVYRQGEIEKKIEAALVMDGITPIRFFSELNRLRGVLFYPQGTPLSPGTLARYIREISQSGTRQTIPYRRIYRAIHNFDLFIN